MISRLITMLALTTATSAWAQGPEPLRADINLRHFLQLDNGSLPTGYGTPDPLPLEESPAGWRPALTTLHARVSGNDLADSGARIRFDGKWRQDSTRFLGGDDREERATPRLGLLRNDVYIRDLYVGKTLSTASLDIAIGRQRLGSGGDVWLDGLHIAKTGSRGVRFGGGAGFQPHPLTYSMDPDYTVVTGYASMVGEGYHVSGSTMAARVGDALDRAALFARGFARPAAGIAVAGNLTLDALGLTFDGTDFSPAVQPRVSMGFFHIVAWPTDDLSLRFHGGTWRNIILVRTLGQAALAQEVVTDVRSPSGARARETLARFFGETVHRAPVYRGRLVAQWQSRPRLKLYQDLEIQHRRTDELTAARFGVGAKASRLGPTRTRLHIYAGVQRRVESDGVTLKASASQRLWRGTQLNAWTMAYSGRTLLLEVPLNILRDGPREEARSQALPIAQREVGDGIKRLEMGAHLAWTGDEHWYGTVGYEGSFETGNPDELRLHTWTTSLGWRN